MPAFNPYARVADRRTQPSVQPCRDFLHVRFCLPASSRLQHMMHGTCMTFVFETHGQPFKGCSHAVQWTAASFALLFPTFKPASRRGQSRG